MDARRTALVLAVAIGGASPSPRSGDLTRITLTYRSGLSSLCVSYRLTVYADGRMGSVGTCEHPRPGRYAGRISRAESARLRGDADAVDWAHAADGAVLVDATETRLEVAFANGMRSATIHDATPAVRRFIEDLDALETDDARWSPSDPLDAYAGRYVDDSRPDERVQLEIFPDDDGIIGLDVLRTGPASCDGDWRIPTTDERATLRGGAGVALATGPVDWRLRFRPSLTGDVLEATGSSGGRFERESLTPHGRRMLEPRTYEPAPNARCALRFVWPDETTLPGDTDRLWLQSNVDADVDDVARHLTIRARDSRHSIRASVERVDAPAVESSLGSLGQAEYDEATFDLGRPTYRVVVPALAPGDYTLEIAAGVRPVEAFGSSVDAAATVIHIGP